jgi:hypothetical protein
LDGLIPVGFEVRSLEDWMSGCGRFLPLREYQRTDQDRADRKEQDHDNDSDPSHAASEPICDPLY